MKFQYLSSLEKSSSCDGIVIPCCAEKEGFSVLSPLSDEMKRCIQLVSDLKDFAARKGEVLILYNREVYASRIVLLGVGQKERVDAEILREAYSKVIATLAPKKLLRLLVLVPEIEDRKAYRVLQPLMEGLVYGSYRFTRYKKTEETDPDVYIHYSSLEEFLIIEQRIVAFRRALFAARDVVNMSTHERSPEGFGHYFLSLAQGTGLQCSLYNEKWLAKQKMGLLLAVGQGAEVPPRMLVLSWTPCPNDTDHTVLVGKGVIFDTGGLNLKPTGSIELMRDDMAGGAVAAGVMLALAALNVQKNVTAVIPLAENCIGSKAFKPGDVFTSRSGLTVEITNTDAEGRLLLADAIDWAIETLHPTRVIDVATLTGACEVALGTDIFAIFSNSDALAVDIEHSAKRAGEPAWRLPLYREYKELLKSDIADCKNSPSIRLGGAISGALFIEQFVRDFPWVHLDIAGVAFTKEGKKYYGKGATGVPLRTLLEYFLPSL